MKKLGLWSRYYSRWDPDVHPRYDKVGVTRRDEEDGKTQVKKCPCLRYYYLPRLFTCFQLFLIC